MKAFSRLEKRVKKRNEKQRAQNVQYAQKKEAKQRAQAVATNRQIQKQVGNSKIGRALMGFTYGFNTGMAPVSYDAKAKKLGFKSYTPTAAAKERGDTTKRTAAFNKSLESSKSFNYANTAGNVVATGLQFLLGGGITKGIAGKALGTGVAKKATGKASEALVQKALRDKAGKTLTRKVLTRMAQNSGRKITETSLRNASKRLTGKIAENVAQDVAGDMTVGLYRDLAQARSQGVDVKNAKQLAPYLAKQVAYNTAIGAVTNGIAPVAGAIKKNKAVWKTVERIGDDGKIHKVKELRNAPAKVRAVRDANGNASDILAKKLKNTGAKKIQKTITQQMSDGTTRTIKRTVAPNDIKMSSLRNAVNDAQYVDEIRRHGINGKTVRQVASEQNKSVRDVIADDYAKRHGVTLDNARATRARALQPENLTTQLSSNEIGTRAVSRRVKNAYNPADTGAQSFRNAEGRRILHRVTDNDYRRAADIEANGTPSIIADRRARLLEQQQATQVSDDLKEQLRQMRANQEAGVAQSVPTQRVAQNSATGTVPPSTASTAEPIDPTMGGRRTGTPVADSQAKDTIANMKGNTKEETQHIDEMLSETGMAKKFSESNSEAIDNARARVDRDGLEQSRISLRRKYDAGEHFSNEDSAEVLIDINRYTDIERNARASGNIEIADKAMKARDELASIEVAELSEAGKSLQAAKMFKKMSPEGRVNSVTMMIKKIEKARGVKGIKVDPELLNQFKKATDEKTQQQLKDQIAREIWNQVPANLTEKLAAWRYMSMLFNPRTHIRNIAGNGIFAPIKGLKNIVGAGIETVRGGAKSKAFLNPLSSNDRDLIKFAQSQWDDVAETFLAGGQKYDLGLMRAEGSRIFKSSWLQKIYDANSMALNKEDEWFAKVAYSRSYAQYLKANKIDPLTASAKTLDKAQRYAWDEALNSTYREANVLAEFINRARKGAQLSLRDIKNADNVGSALLRKGTGTLADALVPFAKTPANIMRNGVYYSPIGLIRGMVKIATAKTAEAQIKAIDSIAQGLTGSGIMALGYFAGKSGLFTGSIPTGDYTTEQRQGKYDTDRGYQEYAMNISNAMGETTHTATADWAVPAAMPFFQGVELYNGMKESLAEGATAQDRINTFGRILTNMGKLADPVLNLSMLSSVENAFDTYTSSGDEQKAVMKFITKSAQSRLGQYVPTAMGQITKSVDENTKSSTPMNYGTLGTWESFRRQQQNKIPVLSKFNADRSDAFGFKTDHKETAKDRLIAYAKNALSPSIIKDVRNTGADKELQRLVKKGQSPEGLYPERQKKSYITTAFGEDKFKINANDVARYNEVHGQSALKGLTALFKTGKYKNASDTEKVEMIKAVYKQATADANKDFATKKGMSERDYTLSLLSTKSKKSYKENEKELKKLGVAPKSYVKIRNKLYDYDAKYPEKYSSGMYVPKTMAATEVKGGVTNLEQAKVATKASESTWVKTYNLSKAGYKASQVAKFVLSEDEKNKLSDENGRLTKDKLYNYINSMNISRKEKWARFETNRYGYKSWSNPF